MYTRLFEFGLVSKLNRYKKMSIYSPLLPVLVSIPLRLAPNSAYAQTPGGSEAVASVGLTAAPLPEAYQW